MTQTPLINPFPVPDDMNVRDLELSMLFLASDQKRPVVIFWGIFMLETKGKKIKMRQIKGGTKPPPQCRRY